MRLKTFLNLTGAIPETAVRRALTVALSVERPTSPEGYALFYRRTLVALYGTKCAEYESISRQPTPAAA
jgi:hypothetical protein